MELGDGGTGGLGPEIIYGTHEDSHVVMSEKVQSLAGSIYQEFERMIARYDEDVVKTLMPLLVNVLECLDAAYQRNQEQDVELELLREDNEQLVTQYEREKGARKNSEQKLLEFEDAAEGERKELSSRLEALESIVRMLELKHKNSMDHASRLEDREAELKKEYSKLHERYTELFKTHVDYMERTKLLHSGHQMVTDRSDSSRFNSNSLNIGRSSGPISIGFASLENAEAVDSVPSSPISSSNSSPRFPAEDDKAIVKVERAQATDSVSLENKSVLTSPVSPINNGSKLHTTREQRSGNTLYQELSFQDADGDEDSSDITGGWVHPGEYASSGMGKEVEKLIMENNELLETKNALNVVKDDLIVKVDELTGELDMLREEILSLNVSRSKLKERISELEEEMKKVKEANNVKQETDEEADVPMAQRKRFTRVEMARVLMERNQYKESFMELQEAVRWSQMIRASRTDPPMDKNNKGIWRFFSNLFNTNERVQRPLVVPHLRYQTNTNQVAPGLKALPRIANDRAEIEVGADKFAMRRALERREQYRQVRAHVRKEDGRVQAYGWSLPGKVNSSTGPMGSISVGKQGGGLPVPVPVYCRPLAETTPEMKIWCAAGVNMMGGYTRDGGLMVGGSVFYSEQPQISVAEPKNEVESLDKELNNGREGALLETKLSSLVWILTTTQQASIVTVIDANNPAELLNSFGVCSGHVLCIASVPGASPTDYRDATDQVDQSENDIKQQVVTEVQKEEYSSGSQNEKHTTVQKSSVKIEEENEIAILGKISYVENDSSASRKIDKYKMEEASTKCSPEESTKEPESDALKDEDSNKENNSETISEKNENETKSSSNSRDVMSTVLATMWMGDDDGNLFVHSAVANWAQRLQTVKLKDAIISIVHVDGRVIVALACAQVAIFKRDPDGEWNVGKYHLVKIGLPHQSVRQLAVVADKVWCGYKNKIHVLQPREMKIVHSLEAHPRRESPVRQMAWLGEGVWVSIRLDSTLRLYHAHTYQHLQDVDIEPYVSKMLGTGKLGFSLVRITSLLISSNRLWIGTSNGVIISVPLSDGGNSRRYSISGTGVRVTPLPGNFIPYCSMAHAQLSFHGHRDNVKFFVAVPGNGGVSAASTPSEAMSASTTSMTGSSKTPSAMLVISGGEGYVDFRIENDYEPRDGASHLLVWQVMRDLPFKEL